MADSGQSAEPVHYKLYGVLYHLGESASSGHYTVDVLHQSGDRGSGEAWLHIDDDVVKEVPREVQHEMFGEHDNKQGDNRCAYMLFYRRTASPPHGHDDPCTSIFSDDFRFFS